MTIKGLIDNDTGLEINDADERYSGGSAKNSGAVKIDRNGDSSEPSYSLSPDVIQHINYISPILDAATFFPETAPVKDITSVFKDYYAYGPGTGTITTSGTSVTGVGSLFTTELTIGAYLDVGGQKRIITAIASDLACTIDTAFSPDITVGTPYVFGWAGIFLENPVLGQLQYWRISFNYSGKSSNAAEGVKIFLKNPLSGFERVLNTTLPESETNADFVTLDVATYADANSLAPPLGTGTGGYQLLIECTKQAIDVVIKDVTRLNSSY